MIDCFSRRLVGWSIAEHMRTELVENALDAAALTRGGLAGAMFHADHGSQYTSMDFVTLCRQIGVAQSMGAVGTSADNALTESFNATLKRETLQGATRWESPRAARLAVFRWITRYNTRRRTRTATISVPPTTKTPTHPIACSKPRNHKPRVQLPGSRPMVMHTAR